MVMREFEVTKEFTFYGEYDDMHEIVDTFNEYHEADDEPHIAHWVDESGCDMFGLWVDSQRYDFDMADLIDACFTWVLPRASMYATFVHGGIWCNDNQMTGERASRIIATLASKLM